jgi:arylsulfatase
LLIPAQAYVAEMLQTLQEFPARQEPASFNVERLLEKLKEGAAAI